MSQPTDDRSSIILKIPGIQPDKLAKLHELLDKCTDERMQSEVAYEIPQLLTSKWSEAHKSYLVEVRIPMSYYEHRRLTRLFADQTFDALGILGPK